MFSSKPLTEDEIVDINARLAEFVSKIKGRNVEIRNLFAKYQIPVMSPLEMDQDDRNSYRTYVRPSVTQRNNDFLFAARKLANKLPKNLKIEAHNLLDDISQQTGQQGGDNGTGTHRCVSITKSGKRCKSTIRGSKKSCGRH